MKFRILLIVMLTSISFLGRAQDDDAWDVNNPPGPSHTTTISTEEGTWMNLDVSPDGKSIVFDLLGDIFIMPITGGSATALRTGLAYETQPKFSPDGMSILFTSDAGGADNIWIMKQDGSEAHQATEETFRLLNNAAWTPDGHYFVARKHFTSGRSLGAGELWLYHIQGGSGIKLTTRKNDQQDVNEPNVSPDGRYVYFSEDMYPGGYFKYNKDPNSQIYMVRRYDRETGDIKNIVSGPGGACRPQLSHDGKQLAYVKRVRTKTVLAVRNLQTGEDRILYSDLSKDQQEAWAIFGVYPSYQWTPDDQHIIIWAGGHLMKVNVASRAASQIPFQVEVSHKLMETVRFEQDIDDAEFPARAIRQAVTSPDGQQLIFNAVGQLWKAPLKGKGAIKPKRLTTDNMMEYEPAFSTDGKALVYVTWSDTEKGSISVREMRSGSTKTIPLEKGIYRTPQFSPDGKSIVFRKESGNMHQGYTYCQEPGIYTVKLDGSDLKKIREHGEYPRYNADGSRIFFQTGGYLFGSLDKAYKSIDLNGEDERELIKSKYAVQFVPSPDNQYIAFIELHKAYIAAFPLTGNPIDLTASTKAIPVTQVAREAGYNLHWSGDGQKIHWTLGNEYFTDGLDERFKFIKDIDSLPPIDSTGRTIALNLTTAIPDGRIALTNARIITMDQDEVIESGTVIIHKDKIETVGRDISIPAGAQIIDCTGKTIMPGFIDAHAHLGAFRFGLSPQQHWQYFTNLAYGVTTTHDPSSNSEMTFSQSEMVRSGRMVGPRIFSTGTILYGADRDFKAPIESLEDALATLKRTKAWGAFSVKSYNQPRRNQRQYVMEAARQLKMNVHPEGGSFFYHNMGMVADGHTAIEHNIPVAPLYSDVLQFWSATTCSNTPTLIVNYGGVNGEYYFYQHDNVWEDEKLLTYTPRPVIDSRSRHRTMIPEEEYDNGHILSAQSCKKLQDAGVDINMGAHGQIQGIGVHWEMKMMTQGGMTNLEALRTATINGARTIGMDSQLGSIEVGKQADLVILAENPLENINHTNTVDYTMVNGFLYDTKTMTRINKGATQERLPFYWELEGAANAWPDIYSAQGMELMTSGCSCRH